MPAKTKRKVGRTPKYAPGTSRAEKRLLRAQAKLEKKGVKIEKVKELTDDQLLDDMKARFAMLREISTGCTTGHIPSVIVPGPPGIGKTYNVDDVMRITGAIHERISGTCSEIELYKLAYQYRFKGNVIIIDDGDKVFRNEETINLLKAMTDSRPIREISHRTNSEFLTDAAGAPIEKETVYEGSVIVLSNIDFQENVDTGRGRGVEHMEALISRSLYLDLRAMSRRAISLWINYICTEGKMFEMEHIDPTLGTAMLKWLHGNQGNLREYSLRTVHKLCNLAKMGPNWASAGLYTLCR